MLTGFIRTLILFFVTTIVLRLMGKRQLAELQPYEVVITLMISDVATQPMSDVEVPLLGGVVAILTLLLLHSLLSVLSYTSMNLRRIICGRPSVLIRNGRICEEEMERLWFDLSDLMEGVRSAGVIGLHEVGCAILETNGTLSVFPKESSAPPSREEMGVEAKYNGIPLLLILDGKLQRRSLRIANLDEGWLRRLMQGQGIEQDKDVLVAALNTQGELLIQEKGENARRLTLKAIAPEEVRW